LDTQIPAKSQVDLHSVLRDLHSMDTAVYEPARAILHDLSAIDLLALMRMEVQRGKAERARDVSGWILLQLGIVAVIIVIFALLALVTHSVCDGSGCNCNPFTGPPEKEHASRELRLMADALGSSTDQHAVGVILEAILLSPFLSTWLKPALQDRLSSVQAEEFRLWNSVQRRSLLRWLEGTKDETVTKCTLAALHAIEQIGTSEAIPPVYRLTFHRDERVRAAARGCGEALQRRALNSRQEQELLRAGAQPAVVSAELLRATSGHGVTAPAELLRPGDRLGN
jgi:hypothetical protein